MLEHIAAMKEEKKMKVFIVYCHPSEDSFTRNVRDAFIKGIVDSGNEYVMSDLYKMNFKTDMCRARDSRKTNWNKYLEQAYRLGLTI